MTSPTTPDDSTACEKHDHGADREAGLLRRLAYLELDASDAERLRELMPEFNSHIEDFVDLFYHHLFRFPVTARHLQDSRRVERLKETQREHFESMLRAVWDEDFVRQRHGVGRAHAEVGIEPEQFLGGYNQYVQFWVRHFLASPSEADGVRLKRLLSLSKAIFLDIGLTLDAYFDETTKQLQHALDMLWETNFELRQFAQLASHDLKTPLATLANLCDEAVDEFGDQMPEEAKRLVQSAAGQAFRLSKVIDELLAAALTHESTEANEVVDSQQVIDEALSRLQPVLAKRGIEVVRTAGLPTVWGNRVRLREAFYNLLANAAKFIERPSGRVEISYQTEGNACTLCVTDNGPGIPREELERIFAPFRRLASESEQPGTGLGLYFTRNLIERQGGCVWAESEPGQGSRFYVKLRRTPQPPTTGH